MPQQFSAFATSFFAFAGRRAPVAAGLILAGALLEGTGILLIVPFLELYSGAPQSRVAVAIAEFMSALGLTTPKQQLLTALTLLLVLLIVRSIVGWARDMSLITLSTGFVDHWRSRVFRALAGASWSRVLTIRRTDVEHSLTSDISRIAFGTDRILRGSTSMAMLVTHLVIAFTLSPILTALILPFIAAATTCMIPLIRKARQLGERLTHAGRNMHSLLGQFLSGLKLAKTHGAEAAYVVQFNSRLADMRQQVLGFTREQARSQLIYQSLTALMVCAIVIIGVFALATPVPVLIAILVVMTRISGPFVAFLQGVQGFANMLPAFGAIQAMTADLTGDAAVARPALIEVGKKSEPSRTGPARVEFHDVHFTHAGQDVPVLNGVSLTINSGEAVALVGPSGAGKTTLVDILVGLLTPTSGSVTIDDTRLMPGTVLERWRRDLAYVPQDPFLFDFSVRENLLWARPESSEAELWEALEVANADGIVRGLKTGLDARVGERGQTLSGGERQRICLARAILRRPRMLILDEAMNAVDLKLERQLFENLILRRRTMTILMITHRRTVVDDIARVCLLHGGRIVEGGLSTASHFGQARSLPTARAT